MYLPFVVLCPPLAPLVRLVASAFPDEKMRKVTHLQKECLTPPT